MSSSNTGPSERRHFTISLHGFPAPANQPSLSGYCQKLETFFRLVSFEGYSLVPSSLGSSPTGKLPYITLHNQISPASGGESNSNPATSTTKDEIIPDSHFIIKTLLTRNLIPDPDSHLTPLQKSDSRAQCIWVEQHIYPCIVHQRWARSHNAVVNKSHLPVPWFIKPLLGWYLQRNIVKTLWAAGVGRYTDEQIDSFIIEWLDGLEARLSTGDNNEWLMGVGVGPGIVDATVWGFLINALGVGEGNREVVGWIKERKGVCGFVRRGAKRWFPEYDVEGMLGEKPAAWEERVY